MGQWVLLFTTDSLPYALHNINILSFPQGLSYRFRYLKKYISKGFIENSDNLKRENKILDGLVIFQFKDNIFFPFRKIKLLNTYDYGNLNFFNTALEELIDIDLNSLPELTEHIKTLISHEQLPPEKLVYLIDNPDFKLNYIHEKQIKEREKSNKIWSNSVDILSRAENLKNLAFLKFDILKGINERKKIFPTILSGEIRGFKLKPGKDYIIEFFEYTNIPSYENKESTEMFTVSLQNEPNRIEIIKPEEIVDGKYDRFDLIFSTLPDALKDAAFLRIKNTQKKEDNRIPDIYIPFCVRLSPIWSIIRPFLLLVSIVAFIDPSFLIWVIKSILSPFPLVLEFFSKLSVHINKEKWVQLGAFLLFIFVFWNFKLQSIFKELKDKVFK
jgi:hypothetical protein